MSNNHCCQREDHPVWKADRGEESPCRHPVSTVLWVLAEAVCQAQGRQLAPAGPNVAEPPALPGLCHIGLASLRQPTGRSVNIIRQLGSIDCAS